MMTIRPAFTAFIRKETGLSVLGPECGQIPTPQPERDLDVLKLASSPERPDDQANRTLQTIVRSATPQEAVGRGFKADQTQGIFRTELHSLVNDSKLGTLFVDTTPNREGVQYFFQSATEG